SAPSSLSSQDDRFPAAALSQSCRKRRLTSASKASSRVYQRSGPAWRQNERMSAGVGMLTRVILIDPHPDEPPTGPREARPDDRLRGVSKGEADIGGLMVRDVPSALLTMRDFDLSRRLLLVA